MINFLSTWLMGIVLAAFAVGLAEQIVPKGREHAALRLVSGLLMTLALLRPLGKISLKEPSVEVGEFGVMLQIQMESYREIQQKELCAIIAENLETYIWDKATGLGLECSVSVSVAVQESGVPLPDTVTISGLRDPELAVWIEEVVGIPAEKQIWQEGSIWTTEKGRGS